MVAAVGVAVVLAVMVVVAMLGLGGASRPVLAANQRREDGSEPDQQGN
jgi:Tfp pilus assembly protein PilX